MTNLEIYTLYQALVNLSQNNNIQMPIKVGYLILKNKNLLEPYYKSLEEARMSVVKRYGVQDSNGDFRVPDDKLKIANEELDEILGIEEEGVILQKIKVDSMQQFLPMDIISDIMPILED